MKNRFNITLTVLVALTLTTSTVASLGSGIYNLIPLIIMLIALGKFLLVAFEFMELRKAHRFWKYLTLFAGLFITGILGIFSIAS